MPSERVIVLTEYKLNHIIRERRVKGAIFFGMLVPEIRRMFFTVLIESVVLSYYGSLRRQSGSGG
ncbi:MAG: hypothetical protein KAH21_11235 [Spirochaetaceae bacterium]|nr:hypothetical protein [Spirochaetaceae bacterium]